MASVEYFLGFARRRSILATFEGRVPVAVSRCRARSRDSPVTMQNSSSIAPLTFFVAATYARAYLRVTSITAVLDRSDPIAPA